MFPEFSQINLFDQIKLRIFFSAINNAYNVHSSTKIAIAIINKIQRLALTEKFQVKYFEMEYN